VTAYAVLTGFTYASVNNQQDLLVRMSCADRMLPTGHQVANVVMDDIFT